MSDITLAWIERILKEISSLDYPYTKIELYPDLSGRVKSGDLVLFSFTHVSLFVSSYEWWKRQGEPA